MIRVIGIGPGSKEYLTPIALKKTKESDVLIGGRRSLILFKDLKKKTNEIKADQIDSIIEFLKKNKDKNVAVLVSGDPGLFSLLSVLRKHFTGQDLEIIPGISSMQLCFAKIAETWHDVKFLSLHGRGSENLLPLVSKNRKICLFTDDNFLPNEIARFLLEQGIKARVVVCESLSYPEENVIETNLEELSKMTFCGNCLLYLNQGD